MASASRACNKRYYPPPFAFVIESRRATITIEDPMIEKRGSGDERNEVEEKKK